MSLITIGLEKISLDGIIGALEEERTSKQTIEIDLELTYDATRAIDADDVACVIDYRDIVKVCKEIALEELFLLETFAYRLKEGLFFSFPVVSLKLKVSKKAYDLPAKISYVKLEEIKG